MYDEKYMRMAIEEGRRGMNKQHGGPFGAVIVKDGEVVSKGHNKVLETNDPTNHAEIVAIRGLSKKLDGPHFPECEIYSVCEPCPMCLSAIYWAKIKKLYFGCSAEDAAKIGFSDKFIYDVIRGERKRKLLKAEQKDRKYCLDLFKEWMQKEDKQMY